MSLFSLMDNVKTIIILIVIMTLYSCTDKPKIGDRYCGLDSEKQSGRAGWEIIVDDILDGAVIYDFKHRYYNEFRENSVSSHGGQTRNKTSFEKFKTVLSKNELYKKYCNELDEEIYLYRLLEKHAHNKDPEFLSLLNQLSENKINIKQFRKKLESLELKKSLHRK